MDAINRLIQLADRYAQDGNIEKCKELSDKIEKALDRIYKIVLTNNNNK